LSYFKYGNLLKALVKCKKLDDKWDKIRGKRQETGRKHIKLEENPRK